MKTFFEYFVRDENGAVTVDWVVLTAGVVGLAVGAVLIMNNGPMNVGTAIGGAIGSMSINTSN